MSQVPPVLSLREDDVKKMIACGVHLGNTNVDPAMVRYIYKRNQYGVHIINLQKTWEKLQLAARAIVSIENPKDVCAVSVSVSAGGTSYAQRAVLKYAKYTGARTIVGRITPGTFTNYLQLEYQEPRLLIVSDPLKDHQPVLEASYVNLPVVAFCNTNVPLRGIDIVIPCNTEGKYSIALMYWFLTREVLRLRATLKRDQDWDVLVDMFVHRDAEEVDRQNKEQAETAKAIAGGPTAEFEVAGEVEGGENEGWAENQGPDWGQGGEVKEWGGSKWEEDQ